MALLALTALGVAEIVAAMFFAYLLDKKGYHFVIYTSLGLTVVTFAVVLAYVGVWRFKLWEASIMCFFWGFLEAFVGLLINCILGFEFESKIVPFALKSSLASFAVFALLFIESVVLTRADFFWYMCLSVGVLGFFSLMLVLCTFKFVSGVKNKSVVNPSSNGSSEFT